MGAACSSSVLTRYHHVKDYLQSKTCMAFDVVEAFLPIEDRPPVILIGENHTINESDFGSQACVTAFTAMKRIVSDCSDPHVKITFVMEDATSLIDYSTPRIVGTDEHGRPNYDTMGVHGIEKLERFSLLDVRDKAERHAHKYKDGLKVVPFDLFDQLRGYFQDGGRKFRNKTVDSIVKEMKIYVYLAFGHFEADQSYLFQYVFPHCDDRVRMETPILRNTVGVLMNEKMKKNQQLRDDAKWLHEYEIEENLDKILSNEGWEPSRTERIFDANIRVYNFSMFRIVHWVYCLTFTLLDAAQPASSTDLIFAKRVVEVFYQEIKADPELHSMFQFITCCGDIITYTVYLRERLSEKNSKNIFVLYGGSSHILRIARLIEESWTHKLDFRRLSEYMCRTLRTKSDRAFCNNLSRLTPELLVDVFVN